MVGVAPGGLDLTQSRTKAGCEGEEAGERGARGPEAGRSQDESRRVRGPASSSQSDKDRAGQAGAERHTRHGPGGGRDGHPVTAHEG